MERYMIIYSWKAIDNIVPNIEPNQRLRTGRRCHTPNVYTLAPSSVISLKESSFSVDGPQPFNIPRHVGHLIKCCTMKFKRHLKTFLKYIPDEPRFSDYTKRCCSQTNFPLHQNKHNKILNIPV